MASNREREWGAGVEAKNGIQLRVLAKECRGTMCNMEKNLLTWLYIQKLCLHGKNTVHHEDFYSFEKSLYQN